ncbi:GPR1/FUN34/yaaH family protein [Desulfofarcimen acetoxidans DSM 771]|jgi:succinate-acetate transporter protein|uniref:GPR1/FUN34/yaaH family protein n=1 Tax=Desulfofarcimen acetoxidans (strain ATCC 49208 / DSM 771 / KCTC 5769 / VKM B-1644 / 5575) TaxID=485916 RepID=C8VZN3_DESAS|nr:GPR1/FUN34/YaaH family transporter [Desulfofarcimen acetoxidans]ACV63011.1 GPR1/FUN34/yaaH family protein [Desulfofarcimen acetoxidans DSM 771]
MADDKIYEIRESSIADPGPLGLAAFALTTFVLSMANAGFIPATVKGVFLPLALFYGGGAQVLAGMWEYKKNNVFGATAFTTYGSFWIALGTLVLFEALKILDFKDQGNIAVGIFLVAFTIFTFYMWIGSFRLNNALIVVFTTLLITFILLDLAEFKFISAKIGGTMGIICAFSAWYTSAAGILNTVYKRVVLPIGPKSSSH